MQAEARKALIFLHVPLFELATKAKTVVWNSEASSDLGLAVQGLSWSSGSDLHLAQAAGFGVLFLPFGGHQGMWL